MEKKNDTWNIRRLINETIIPSTQCIIFKIVGFLFEFLCTKNSKKCTKELLTPTLQTQLTPPRNNPPSNEPKLKQI